VEQVKLWAWWAQRQGLDGSLAGKTGREALNCSGWSRSVGGASPYIAIFARAGRSMAEIDAEVAAAEIHELPSARSCTHVLPKDDYALGLKVGQGFGDAAELAQARKFLGVTDDEVDKLCVAICRSLQKGPLDPKQMKDAVGDAARHLGEEGKKRGITTTLSLGLSRLQSNGSIRRIPADGRLDRQKYRYALWAPNPMEGFRLTSAESFTELARHYFRWVGPSTAAHFRWFSGLGVGASKAALEPLGLIPVEEGSDYLVPPADLDSFKAFEPPSEPDYSLIASLDAHLNLRRDILCLLAEEDKGRSVPTDKKLVPVAGLQNLYSNAILDRGRIVGLWEYDPEAKEIVSVSFVKRTQGQKSAIEKTEAFIRDQLGDCRSFSLDSAESRKPKLALLRALRAEE
jgi:hypothetical protein